MKAAVAIIDTAAFLYNAQFYNDRTSFIINSNSS